MHRGDGGFARGGLLGLLTGSWSGSRRFLTRTMMISGSRCSSPTIARKSSILYPDRHSEGSRDT